MATASIERGDVAGLDGLGVEALVLLSWTFRGQPQGVAGMIDWRLCGRLARMSMKQQFTGAAGESLLMPTLDRLPAGRLFWFGLGEAGSEVDFRTITGQLQAAGATRIAVVAPDDGRAHELLGEFVRAAKGRFDALVLLDLDDALREHEESLKKMAANAAFSWAGGIRAR